MLVLANAKLRTRQYYILGEVTTYIGQELLFSVLESSDGTLLSREAIDERLITARFGSKLGKLTIIMCYAPTEDTDSAVKDKFY